LARDAQRHNARVTDAVVFSGVTYKAVLATYPSDII